MFSVASFSSRARPARSVHRSRTVRTRTDRVNVRRLVSRTMDRTPSDSGIGPRQTRVRPFSRIASRRQAHASQLFEVFGLSAWNGPPIAAWRGSTAHRFCRMSLQTKFRWLKSGERMHFDARTIQKNPPRQISSSHLWSIADRERGDARRRSRSQARRLRGFSLSAIGPNCFPVIGPPRDERLQFNTWSAIVTLEEELDDSDMCALGRAGRAGTQ